MKLSSFLLFLKHLKTFKEKYTKILKNRKIGKFVEKSEEKSFLDLYVYINYLCT